MPFVSMQGFVETLPLARNSASQPGRSQPRLREVFLGLLGLQRIAILMQQLLFETAVEERWWER